MTFSGSSSDEARRPQDLPIVNTGKVIQEAEAVRKVPFVPTGFIGIWVTRFVTARTNVRKLIILFTHNIYFTTAYILSIVGIYNYLRFYYKDQLVSYGFQSNMPGIAEQIQTQNVATFNFVTMPAAIEKAETIVPSEETLPNLLAKFAVTPFVDRLDLYPEAALIQFNSNWTNILANNVQLHYPAPSMQHEFPGLPQINQWHVASSLPLTEFQPYNELAQRDPWISARGFFDVVDEFPTQMAQPTAPISMSEISQFALTPTLGVLSVLPDSQQPAQGGPVLSFAVLRSTQLKGLLRFQSPRQPFYPILVNSLSGLPDFKPQIDPNFNYPVPAKFDDWAFFMTYGYLPSSSERTAGYDKNMRVSSIFNDASVYQLTKNELKVLEAGPPKLIFPNPPVSPATLIAQESGETSTSTRRLFKTPSRQTMLDLLNDVKAATKTVVTELGRTLLPSRTQRLKSKTVRPAALSRNVDEAETTGLNEVDRAVYFEERAKERKAFLASSSPSFKAYVKDIRKYRKDLRNYTLKYKSTKLRHAEQQREYDLLTQRANNIAALWEQSVPELIINTLNTDRSATVPWMFDPFTVSTDSWLRATQLPALYVDGVGNRQVQPNAEQGLTFTKIRDFVLFSTTKAEFSDSTKDKTIVNAFIPFTASQEQYPTFMFNQILSAERDNGYAAFYELLAKYDLSAGSQDANPKVYSLGLRPTNQHLRPIMNWLHDANKQPLAVPFTFPAGNEYHWAQSMQYLLQELDNNPDLRKQFSKQLKIRPKGEFSSEQLFNLALTKLNFETRAYLDRVHQLQVITEDQTAFASGFHYASLISDLNTYLSAQQHYHAVVRHALGCGFVRPYAANFSEFIPNDYPILNGFMFPDFDFDEMTEQWKTSDMRYGLNKETPWKVFQTMVQRRPLEVFMPAGYRPFMSTIFSDIERVEEQNIGLAPKYTLQRRPLYYPAYDELQALYGDLDISFLPEKPVPKTMMGEYDPEIEDYSEEAFPVLFKKKSPFLKIRRSLYRSPVTGDVITTSPPVEGFLKYLLSPANWLKDRPANFRGQVSRFVGENQNRSQEQHQMILEQMGTHPDFTMDADLLMPDAESLDARKKEFPLKLHGYTREYFRPESIEPLSPEEKDGLLGKYARYMDDLGLPEEEVGRRFGWSNWLNSSREDRQLETNEDYYLPRLTMDEWHTLFKTVLETANETNDPDFLFDLAPLVLMPINASQFEGFEASILSPTSGASALTQVLLAITNHNMGAYDLLGYENPINLLNYQDQQMIRLGRTPKIIPHFEMPREELQPDPTGAPTLLETSSRRIPSNGMARWSSAEQYIQVATGRKSKPRDWSKITRPVIRCLQKLPGGKKLMREKLFYDNREPITKYTWCYAGQIIFFFWAYDMFWLIWGTSWEELKSVLLANFGGRRLRSLFVELGIASPFTFRVSTDNSRRFETSAGGLNRRLFQQVCEVVLHLRNKCRPGTSMPKGLLMIGPPGTGKTYMVQILAGEANVPVVTQTAGELFNKRNFADLEMDQMFTPAEQLGFAFDRARQLAPSILFIDEIDALGAARESVMAQPMDLYPNPELDLYGHVRVARMPRHKPFIPKITEKQRVLTKVFGKNTVEDLRDARRRAFSYDPYPGADPTRVDELFAYKEEVVSQQIHQVGTLTEFLVQIDGLNPLEQVFVIGATNRFEVLDLALTRPGRLERIIELFPPGRNGRISIFKQACSKLGATPDISWGYLANRTRGLSVANITTAVNHSAIRAIVQNSVHTLETLEYGLETMVRHKRGAQMIATRPLPDPSTMRSRDPYLYLRIAYYNAGKAILQNILPTHPSLPYVKLAVEPFDPEYRIRDLFLHNRSRAELETRLIGLHAGKAAEFLMLYGNTQALQDERMRNTMSLLESDLGYDELAYAAELANAMVAEWYLYDDKRLPVNTRLRVNDNQKNFHKPIDWETRDALEYIADIRTKDFKGLHSERDKPQMDVTTKSYPPGHTIYQRYEQLAYWATRISRIELNAVTQDYIKWYNYYLRQPFRYERSRFWIPPDLHYQQGIAAPLDFETFVRFVHESPVNWEALRKTWDDQLLEWDPTGEIDQNSKRPTITFSDWHDVDRDDLFQSLMISSFDTAMGILQEYRPLVERTVKHILEFKILREDTINEFIADYTRTRLQENLAVPIKMSDYADLEVLRGLASDGAVSNDITNDALPPLIAPYPTQRPQEDFVLTEENTELIYERSWGPQSRKPFSKKVPLALFGDKSLLERAQPIQEPEWLEDYIAWWELQWIEAAEAKEQARQEAKAENQQGTKPTEPPVA
jgi:SpoVK/Ycf46/Vps4 family AAA+-type ATPase